MREEKGCISLTGGPVEYLRLDAGKGPELLLLHEGLGSVSMWREFPRRLAEATGCSVFAYSRYGYGASASCALPRPMTYMHDEALMVLPKLIAAAGIGPHILVGHSDGGSIAIIHAGARPSPDLKGIALLAPHVFVEDVSVASIIKAREIWVTTDMRAKLARYHGGNVDCAFLGWNGGWTDPGFREWNIEPYLAGIRVPVVAIQGRDDEYGTMAQIDAIQQGVASARLVKLEACGHAPHKDQEDKVISEIKSLMNGFAMFN